MNRPKYVPPPLRAYRGKLRPYFPVIFALALAGQGNTQIAGLLCAMGFDGSCGEHANTGGWSRERMRTYATAGMVNTLMLRWRRSPDQAERRKRWVRGRVESMIEALEAAE